MSVKARKLCNALSEDNKVKIDFLETMQKAYKETAKYMHLCTPVRNSSLWELWTLTLLDTVPHATLVTLLLKNFPNVNRQAERMPHGPLPGALFLLACSQMSSQKRSKRI